MTLRKLSLSSYTTGRMTQAGRVPTAPSMCMTLLRCIDMLCLDSLSSSDLLSLFSLMRLDGLWDSPTFSFPILFLLFFSLNILIFPYEAGSAVCLPHFWESYTLSILLFALPHVDYKDGIKDKLHCALFLTHSSGATCHVHSNIKESKIGKYIISWIGYRRLTENPSTKAKV